MVLFFFLLLSFILFNFTKYFIIKILEADPDSSNEASLQSLTGNKKERKYSKDNSAASKPTRKTSVENSQHIQNEEKYVTDKFREYLLFGSGKDALGTFNTKIFTYSKLFLIKIHITFSEWAMSHGLWGHALFLASKLDRRTYANVMARFANGLLPNDPLQTLYQLMSGRQPAAVTVTSISSMLIYIYVPFLYLSFVLVCFG